MAGFGRYTLSLLAICCLLILAMYVDIFGFSVALPAAACDLGLSTNQQAMLSAAPLIGVMTSSYAWGLCADTLGRRSTLLAAMTVGAILNIAASVAPSYETLALIKFFSGAFTASANAAAFVLLGECAPRRRRRQFMFVMASATMYSQLFICVFAIPIFNMRFHISLSWLDYRPWRLLLQVISLPAVVGVIGLVFLHESPKFLMSKGRDEDAIEVLRAIHRANCGEKEAYEVTSVYLEEPPVPRAVGGSLARHLWHQTAPLFQTPLRKNNLILYFMLLCAYMTSTGFTMWVPTMTNAFFNGEDSSGKSFCEVASTAALSSTNSTDLNCDSVIQQSTLYAVMGYSGGGGTLTLLLTFIVVPIGGKRTTILVFLISAAAGLTLLFIRVPLLSVALFYVFLYVSLILGTANSYLVDLNPTHLRGMVTCLSVVVARGFGFFSVQIIAALLADHCTAMVSGYILLVIAGLAVSFFLPPDTKEEASENETAVTRIQTVVANDEKTRF
ncbi:synaptic vesicle glycoprotein 2B [Plutella xylostella]|uniref:synaptic vesicle glycoprotein 2B n=1 Tax=Plutella xylostella TaxID=51655 RepID=UPI0020323DEC|nr:synaptic vesicle glycoprotein 2B [Plutella xylostella]